MKALAILAVATVAAAIGASPAVSGTLDTIKQRGVVKCGVFENLPGMASLDDKGQWQGMSVDYCKALSAAVFGTPDKVELSKLTFAQGIPAIKSGEMDMVDLAITATIGRETELGLEFIGPTIYSGFGFMVHKRANATKISDLNGAAICVVSGSLHDTWIADYFRARNMTFTPVPIETSAQMFPLYEEGRCDVVTMEPPFLAARRLRLKAPADHIILNELFAKSYMGPIVRGDDRQWSQIARWTHFALVTAEELGLTQENIDKQAAESKDPNVLRFTGKEAKIGEKMGLANDWAWKVVKAVGNYGEVWERNYGMKSAMKLPRGPNALAQDGGMQWAPNWR